MQRRIGLGRGRAPTRTFYDSRHSILVLDVLFKHEKSRLQCNESYFSGFEETPRPTGSRGNGQLPRCVNADFYAIEQWY